MRKEYHVYAKCSGHTRYLSEQYSGTRSQCLTYIKNRVRNNQPTQFLIVSCLGIDAASRRYL